MTRLTAVRFGLAQCAVVGVLVMAAVGHLGPTSTLVAVCLVTSGAAVLLPLTWAAALGTVAWACFTGFVTNRLGELTFATPDLTRLVLLVVAAGAAHWVVWSGSTGQAGR